MIKFLFFLIFISYMGWKGRKMWKEKAKKDLILVSGIGLLAAYFMLANNWGWTTINLLMATESFTQPLGRWLQEVFGTTL